MLYVMTTVTLNLPSNESCLLDRRMFAYCSSIGGLIFRVRAVWNSTAVAAQRPLTDDELEKSQRDVIKWMIGGAVVLTYSSILAIPLYFKYITVISYIASTTLTIFEQLNLRVFNFHSLVDPLQG
jgi:hypothetical protein